MASGAHEPRMLTPAHTRGVYLWAGDATIRLQRSKFPDAAVDVDAHRSAYTRAAAGELNRIGLNLAFLSMNWGFPPEEESTHWDQFREAAAHYHAEGFRVIGYVQSSNCLAEGSHAGRDWYARTPAGRTIPYYRRRLMTCWNHPEWIEQVSTRARQVIGRGGDGVFFDNLWMGATPWILNGMIGGFAGCACARCASAFEGETGRPLPRSLRPGEPDTQAYLCWRRRIVATRLRDWANVVRAERADALVLANNCDVMLRPTADLFGLDPIELARFQDAILVENIAMPRIEGRSLIGNALPLKALRAVAPDRTILSVTYQKGIGLDRPPPERAAARAVAEAAALGVSPVLKGSEYLDGHGRFTVITADALAGTRAAVAPFLDWMAANATLLEGLQPDPDVLVLCDTTACSREFEAASSATFATAISLVAGGVPFDFVSPDRLARSNPTLPVLIPPGIDFPESVRHRAIRIEASDLLPVRTTPRRISEARRGILDPLMRGFSRSYFTSARFRRTIDATGLTARFLRSTFFTLPDRYRVLCERVPAARPRARPEGPALIERWSRPDGLRLVHMINYSDHPVRLHLPGTWSGFRLHTPDGESHLDHRIATVLHLATHAALEWPARPEPLEVPSTVVPPEDSGRAG